MSTAIFFNLVVDPLTKSLSIETAVPLLLLFAYPSILLLNLFNAPQERSRRWENTSPTSPHRQYYRRHHRLPFHLRSRIKLKYQASSRPRHYRCLPNYRRRPIKSRNWRRYFRSTLDESPKKSSPKKEQARNDSAKDDKSLTYFDAVQDLNELPELDAFFDAQPKLPEEPKPPDPLPGSIEWTEACDLFSICTGTDASSAPPISPFELLNSPSVHDPFSTVQLPCACLTCSTTNRCFSSGTCCCANLEYDSTQDLPKE